MQFSEAFRFTPDGMKIDFSMSKSLKIFYWSLCIVVNFGKKSTMSLSTDDFGDCHLGVLWLCAGLRSALGQCRVDTPPWGMHG